MKNIFKRTMALTTMLSLLNANATIAENLENNHQHNRHTHLAKVKHKNKKKKIKPHNPHSSIIHKTSPILHEIPTVSPIKKVYTYLHENKVYHHVFNPLKIIVNPVAYIRRGIASWYGPGFQGRLTASGIVFDTNSTMCAMRYMKMHTWVHVKNLNTGLSTMCEILDVGPFVDGRIIDLSHAVKNAIGMEGLAPVEVWTN